MSRTSAVRERILKRPSFATVLALLAVVIALTAPGNALPGRGTVDSGDLRRNAVTTPKIKNKAVTSAKVRPRAIAPAHLKEHPMWAIVGKDGAILQSSGVLEVEVGTTGIYRVRFAKSVAQRLVQANVYNDLADGGNGQISVFKCSGPFGGCAAVGSDPTWVTVNTEDSEGTGAYRSFQVVALPPTPGVTTALRPVAPRRGWGEGR